MDADELDISPPRRIKAGVIVVVALLHLAAVLALVRAFAPQFTAQAVDAVVATFTVTISAPPPPPEPASAPDPAGAAGEAGRKAVPRAVKAEQPRVVIAPVPAPRASGPGSADSSGARDAGSGTGAGGAGAGTGSGNGGAGSGGGAAAKAVKIAGDINSARDYPKATRDLRIDDYVVIQLTVGRDGHPRACQVRRASRDAEADRITCRLALERFRFTPATDAAGNAVESTYGWQQKWFYPKPKP